MRKLILVIVALAAAIGVYLIQRSRGSHATPPAPAPLAARPTMDPPERADVDPVFPPMDRSSYVAAKKRGDPTPGATVYRDYTDDFVDYNPEITKAHMAQEGITLQEVKQLTYYGLLAMQIVDFEAVEDLTGKHLTDEERKAAFSAMHKSSDRMKAAVRDAVRQGVPVADRLALMEKLWQEFLTEYFALTGMTPSLLDELQGMLLSESEAQIGQETEEAPDAGVAAGWHQK